MTLEDLTRYESAAVAASNVKKDNQLAVVALGDFYKNILDEDDPIINKSLQEAASGGEAGLTNYGVAQAIQSYSGKYEKAFNSTKFSELVNYLEEGYSIPEEAKSALSEYNESTLEDLSKKTKDKEISDEDKEKIGKAYQAINTLRDRKLREKTLSIFNSLTTQTLESLYPKENSEGETA